MKGKIISIIGPEGVGKTFLTRKLAEELNGISIDENLKSFPKGNLKKFNYIRKEHINRLKRAIFLKKEGKCVIVDKWFFVNKFYITKFTKGILQKVLLFRHIIDEIILPKPDIIIYLDSENSKIKEFLKGKGRILKFEQILEIKKSYYDFYIKYKPNWFYLDRTHLDFNKIKDLEIILKKINK